MGFSKGHSKSASFDEIRRIRRMLEECSNYRHNFAADALDVWLPPTDVYETEDALIVQMSLPGVKPEDIKILLRGDVLTVYGRRESGVDQKCVGYHQMEIRHGYFERSIRISIPFDADRAAASLDRGILKLWVPKAQKITSRVMVIKIKI